MGCKGSWVQIPPPRLVCNHFLPFPLNLHGFRGWLQKKPPFYSKFYQIARLPIRLPSTSFDFTGRSQFSIFFSHLVLLLFRFPTRLPIRLPEKTTILVDFSRVSRLPTVPIRLPNQHFTFFQTKYPTGFV